MRHAEKVQGERASVNMHFLKKNFPQSTEVKPLISDPGMNLNKLAMCEYQENGLSIKPGDPVERPGGTPIQQIPRRPLDLDTEAL